jgi:hypothetical protein
VHAHAKRLVSVDKLATVLEVYNQRAMFCCAFLLWIEGLNANNIHKEKFPVYGGECLLCTAVHNRVEKFSQGRSKVADDAQPGFPVATERSKCAASDIVDSS